jgi:hypothetical protein
VTLVTAENQLQAVSPDEFAMFVRQVLHAQRDAAFADVDAVLETPLVAQSEALPSPVHPIRSDRLIADRACALLRDAPAMTLAASKLVEALEQAGTPVESRLLLIVLRSFPERCSLMPSQDDVIIALNKSWVQAQRR